MGGKASGATCAMVAEARAEIKSHLFERAAALLACALLRFYAIPPLALGVALDAFHPPQRIVEIFCLHRSSPGASIVHGKCLLTMSNAAFLL